MIAVFLNAWNYKLNLIFFIYDQIFKGLITNFRNDFDTLHIEI